MHTSIRELPEAERRERQEQIGLVVVTRRTEPPLTERRRNMHETTNQGPKTNPASRAQQSLDNTLTRLENLAANSMDTSFKAVAMLELKRAAVYVPILFSSGLGLAWACKRLLVPGAK